MSTLSTAAHARRPSSDHPPRAGLADLRGEIDRIDDTLLDLLERRLAVAQTIGELKTREPGPYLNWRPAREADLLTRLLSAAKPTSRDLVLAVWRELMSAGLAAQGSVEVAVWDGGDPRLRERAARRFGAALGCRPAGSAQAALERASEEDVLAVLPLAAGETWWTDLADRHPNLWVCEALDGPRGVSDPAALVVARVDPAALASGRTFVASLGGDACLQGRATRLLGYDTGARLYVADELSNATLDAADRRRGVIGRAPPFCLSPVDLLPPGVPS